MSVQYPVFVLADDGEVTLHASLKEIETNLESIDVENGVYQFWDSQGVRLRCFVQGLNKLGLEEVELDIEGIQAAVSNYVRQYVSSDDKQPIPTMENLQEVILRINAPRKRGEFLSGFFVPKIIGRSLSDEAEK